MRAFGLKRCASQSGACPTEVALMDQGGAEVTGGIVPAVEVEQNLVGFYPTRQHNIIGVNIGGRGKVKNHVVDPIAIDRQRAVGQVYRTHGENPVALCVESASRCVYCGTRIECYAP